MIDFFKLILIKVFSYLLILILILIQLHNAS